MTVLWSKKPFILGALYTAVICLADYMTDRVISLPWQPISVLGIAVAFYLGFKNNSSYDRTWEARKIWGSIVNNSRSFGAALVSFVKGSEKDQLIKELIYRHIAWMVALRHQLRLSKPWEHVEERVKGLYFPTVCEGYEEQLEKELSIYLSQAEVQALEGKTNRATQIQRRQSERLQELYDQGYFNDFRHMQLVELINTFYADQGKSERIKNFPFPRQYASTALWLCFVFCLFVPFGLLDVFRNGSLLMFWLCPLISGLIIWVFFLMEKIGDYSENPFEGSYNDVPITNISRAIEIDLREMINDDDIPPPVEAKNGFLM